MRPSARLGLLILPALLACTDKAGSACPEGAHCPPPDSADPCREPPALSVAILAPTAADTPGEGDTVAFTGAVETTVDPADLTWAWAWEGTPVGDAASGSFVALPAGVGSLSVTVSEPCGGSASAAVSLTVTTPAPSGVTRFGAETGLPAGPWYGLSVGPDGRVWAAGAGGLVRLDPDTGLAHVWTAADGLTTDTPSAVLAHSDGTIWVGHLADTTRQGERVSVGADDTLTVVDLIAYVASMEIIGIFRFAEQPYGVGAGDVWIGTNEGLCVWDADLDVFDEHAHPTHPHGYTRGVAFTEDGDTWNGDANQVSRWRYSHDGGLGSDDLVEYWAPWPVKAKTEVYITDLDQSEGTLWITSSSYGVARVIVGAEVGASVTEPLAAPFPVSAEAVRADGAGGVWIGALDGLYRYDGGLQRWQGGWMPDDHVQQLAVDRRTDPPTVWAATDVALLRVVGVPDDGEVLVEGP